MTIKECIDIVDNIKPNQYSIKDKVMWLSFLDETIINDVLKTHEGYDGRYDEFAGYSEDKLSVSLIVPSPYDRLYTAYLKMQIDKENGETARYNSSMALYNTYMLEYRKYYNKTHMPLSHDTRRGGGVSVKVDVNLTEAEFEAIKRDVYNQLSNDVGEVISPDKLYDIVMSYMLNNTKTFKGNDGHTPIKGSDYFTEDEVNQFKADAKGDDGYSPAVEIDKNSGVNGTRVVITDKGGRHEFYVLNGTDGKDGKDAYVVTKMSELENDAGYLQSKELTEGLPLALVFDEEMFMAVSKGIVLGGTEGVVLQCLGSENASISLDSDGIRMVSEKGVHIYKVTNENTSAVNKGYVDGLVGSVESALDSIIAMQNSKIGGDIS